ncbi:hypothetical protein HZC33_01100 [Candidatus Wolfebacteria bacterium]|nr:hypothetical protein [Candidatus Wolfebacteria bacterium]
MLIYTIIAVVKIFLIISIIGLIAAIVWLWIKSLPLRYKLTPSETLDYIKTMQVSEGKYRKIIKQKEVSSKKWKNLLEKIKSGDERDYRLAIIEADSIIDELLIAYDHPGEDMGERLKSLNEYEMENLNGLWQAHKIRNKLAHEADLVLPVDEMKKIIGLYHKALEELLSKKIEIAKDIEKILEENKANEEKIITKK